jgi:hypothetical protein
MPRSSKRKRALRVQAEVADEEVDIASAPDDDREPGDPEHKGENGDTNHRLEVEAEIWDSFREEFHEGPYLFSSSLVKTRLTGPAAVEQLPLYLHRSYALLRELDEQVTGKVVHHAFWTVRDAFTAFCFFLLGNYNRIHPTLQKYILLRRSLAPHQQDPNANPNPDVVVKEQSPPPESEVKAASDGAGDSRSSILSSEKQSGKDACVPFPSVLNAEHTDPAPSTSRELLRHLGWLMDEVARGSQEKVGLAQAAYDSVRTSFVCLLLRVSLIDVTRTWDPPLFSVFFFFAL